MDCCNYMPYRPPYYGTPYYESMPYPADYYGHPYQDYYGNAPSYYGQHWQCANPAFTDYVYNPKEARIRKAMREASRERALSVTPMSPRAVRRPSSVAPTPSSHAPWNFGNEDQLMMAPAAHGMRGSLIGSPMCGSSGFPIQAAESGPFAMQSMHYGKHSMHPLAHSASGTYMQANSIPHLPQPPDLWQPYEDPMRNTPGPYILPQQMGYAQPPTVPSPAILPSTPHLEKPKLEPETFHHIEDSQSSHTNENVPPNGDGDKLPMVDPVFENKVDSIQPLMGNGNMHAPTSEPFMPSYGENIMSQGNVYEKNETVKSKKSPIPTATQRNHFRPSKKSLPDFNEAFGSTERGRFQRPPNNKGYLDYFLQENDIHKFMEYQ